MLLKTWWPKATNFQKTRQSKDNRSKATAKNIKHRRRSVINEMVAEGHHLPEDKAKPRH